MTDSNAADPLDLLSPATRRNPYPAFRRLREADPVHFDDGVVEAPARQNSE